METILLGVGGVALVSAHSEFPHSLSVYHTPGGWKAEVCVCACVCVPLCFPSTPLRVSTKGKWLQPFAVS